MWFLKKCYYSKFLLCVFCKKKRFLNKMSQPNFRNYYTVHVYGIRCIWNTVVTIHTAEIRVIVVEVKIILFGVTGAVKLSNLLFIHIVSNNICMLLCPK